MTAIPATPSPRSLDSFKTFFLGATLWDLVLGAGIFLFFRQIFGALHADLPSSTSYVQMISGFVFVQGIGYWFVYRRMVENVDIVRMGIIYKLIYAGVCFYYLAIGNLPHVFFAWLGVVDLFFVVGFVRFLGRVRAAGSR